MAKLLSAGRNGSSNHPIYRSATGRNTQVEATQSLQPQMFAAKNYEKYGWRRISHRL
jgi:hypothetical protein